MLLKEARTYFNNHLSDKYSSNELTSMFFLIMDDVFGISKVDILVSNTISFNEEQQALFIDICTRLERFEPIQYIIGWVMFYNLRFKVVSGVLIPRPETEELVQTIIDNHSHQRGLRIADIGTGTGCISISLAKNLNTSAVFAIDISETCLQLAKDNSLNNMVKVNVIECDILQDESRNLCKNLDIVVSNPPYVTHKEKTQMHANVLDYEPHLALFVDNENPLIYYKAIAQCAKQWLKPNGVVYVEINERFGLETAQVFIENGFINISVIHDMFGKNRFVKACKS